jgi:gamma-glutamyl:cysteine ligase YbdK (ATP-grasp superfamily)
MGQDIGVSHFRHYDFRQFDRLVAQEMDVLHELFVQQRFSARRAVAGLELELWIVDAEGNPLAINDELLAQINSPDVVHEMSRFNMELNVEPQALADRGLDLLASALERTWRECRRIASERGASVVAVGTLPTLADAHLSLKNMSSPLRYQALNEQVLRLRQGRPIRLEIQGRERLTTEHRDVMLESATTSFQLHLQVALCEAVRCYNASVILSAPLVALSANSPFLFGKSLWSETRIPLFEQAVDVGAGMLPRVTLGSGYVEHSLEECFVENHRDYPVMLPLAMDGPSENFAHLRLHNGTIWRWNRALVGFDDSGQPHLRIEQRVAPAGPTVIDMAANMAFYYGLVEALGTCEQAPEGRLPFMMARSNFYRAARYGLDARLLWLDWQPVTARDLILQELLPLAREGLGQLRVASETADRLLGVIEARVSCGQNGAVWQRRFIERHGRDLALLTREYRARQEAGLPVHTWSV